MMGRRKKKGPSAPVLPAVQVESWKAGNDAILIGIASRKDLNGQRVDVVSLDAERVVVQLGSGECIKVLPDRLALPPTPSAWKSKLSTPDALHEQAVEKRKGKDKFAAFALDFEAMQIASTHGLSDSRLRFSSKIAEHDAEEATFSELSSCDAQGALKFAEIMRQVNTKLELDHESAKRAMNSTSVGRMNWATMQSEAPFLSRLLEMQDEYFDSLDEKAISQLLTKQVRPSHIALDSPESGGPCKPEVEVVRPAAFKAPKCRSVVLDQSVLPVFLPPVTEVHTANVDPVSPLCWAFTCSMPPFAKTADPSCMPPALQWNYSMYHLAHFYEKGIKKFHIEDDLETEALMLEVLDLRACPEGLGLDRKDFKAPLDDKQLGAIPVFFVKYFHQTKATMDPSCLPLLYDWTQEGKSVVVKIRAESSSEVRYGKDVLGANRCNVEQTVASPATSKQLFRRSVLFPPRREDLEKANIPVEPLSICSFCGKHAPKLLSCSRCMVTKYCGQECQKQHWKTSHKDVCGRVKDPSSSSCQGPERPSFLFDAQAAPAGSEPGMCTLNFSQKTGRATSSMDLNGPGLGSIGKVRKPRNVHGETEFIVKLQPPMMGRGPWMCYDQHRSFQTYVLESTDGLDRALSLLKDHGIRAQNPMFPGVTAFKGFFKARWEGSNIRVFLDGLAPAQTW